MHYETEIAIIGTGFAGIGMAIRLKQAGIHDFIVFEKGDDVGGTWRDNFYPGAACDVQSHLYSFSFAPNPDWSRQFAPQEEILQYLRSCAEKYDLLSHIHFGNSMVEGRYDEAAGLWRGKTQRGDTLEARVVVTGCGAFNKPVLPDVKGIHEFQGELLHTARWKKGASVKGKRVGVIGTGASAIQVVPAIAGETQKLTLFQRTPPWIMPKPNPEYTPEQKSRFRKLPITQRAERAKIYAQNELFATGFVVNPKLMKQGERFAMSYLKKKVSDPVLREKLTPKYTIGCKRILLSSEYLTTLTRDNVEVVTDGIAEVRAHSVVTRDGVEHPIDTLVCATGFQVSENVAPFAIHGRGGLDLNEAWRDNGAEAYKGTTVKDFPNAFIIMGPNTGLGHSSMVLMIEAQIGYTLQAIQLMRKEQLKSIEVRPEAQASYNEWVQKRMAKTVWQRGGCVSYYSTASGKNTTLFPGFTFEFMAKTRKFDADSYRLVKRSESDLKRSVVRLLGLARGRRHAAKAAAPRTHAEPRASTDAAE
jgi:cation diffusion facilitator CzcD-associated flavoprotein CzcO